MTIPSAQTRRTGGEALVDALRHHGIDTLFGLPGAQMYGFFDALAQSPVRTIGSRHEQGAGYMAFGYASSTGRPAVFSVVPGPGVLNAGAAALTALGCNEPVLCITGQVPTSFLGQGSGHLHEMPDQLAAMRQFYKWADRVNHPALAGASVAQAFREMLSGRRGPAALEMPWDMILSAAPVAPPVVLDPVPAPAADLAQVDALADAIRAAKAPMIFVGGGAVEAADEILALAERIGAPVVSFRRGRGIVSDAHPLGLTCAEGMKLWQHTDLAIGIGTRMELPRWRWTFRPAAVKWARIDIDPAEMRRFKPDIGIVADAQQGVAALLEALAVRAPATDGRRERIAEAKRRTAAAIRTVQPQMAYLDVLREVLPHDAFVTDELSQVGFTSFFGFPVYRPRSYVSSGYQGNLGSGFPTSLGVKAAHPDKAVVAICGDGGFMFGMPELATAVQYGLGVITLVFNNDSYGNVRRDQLTGFGGRVIGADLVNPDFAALARTFGASGACVSDPAAFRVALETALKDGRPWVIEIKVPRDVDSNPWPFIMAQTAPADSV
jgi:acetolactate synthase-1/2/3 large subunit